MAEPWPCSPEPKRKDNRQVPFIGMTSAQDLRLLSDASAC